MIDFPLDFPLQDTETQYSKDAFLSCMDDKCLNQDLQWESLTTCKNPYYFEDKDDAEDDARESAYMYKSFDDGKSKQPRFYVMSVPEWEKLKEKDYNERHGIVELTLF